jgi:hypothetical protein
MFESPGKVLEGDGGGGECLLSVEMEDGWFNTVADVRRGPVTEIFAMHLILLLMH